jgi:hypothetical protein
MAGAEKENSLVVFEKGKSSVVSEKTYMTRHHVFFPSKITDTSHFDPELNGGAVEEDYDRGISCTMIQRPLEDVLKEQKKIFETTGVSKPTGLIMKLVPVKNTMVNQGLQNERHKQTEHDTFYIVQDKNTLASILLSEKWTDTAGDLWESFPEHYGQGSNMRKLVLQNIYESRAQNVGIDNGPKEMTTYKLEFVDKKVQAVKEEFGKVEEKLVPAIEKFQKSMGPLLEGLQKIMKDNPEAVEELMHEKLKEFSKMEKMENKRIPDDLQEFFKVLQNGRSGSK